MAHQVGFQVIVLALVAVVAMTSYASSDSSGASVSILNAGFDPVLVHCESKDSDLGAYPVEPGSSYSWDFSANIFGMTLYSCEFFWKTYTQKFQVWKGSYYDGRPPCSVTGLCKYKVSSDGFYYGLQSDGTGDNCTAGDQIWAFYKPWLPVNASALMPH